MSSEPAPVRALLYADERREPGAAAYRLFVGTDFVHIPLSGGIPFARYGRDRYVGLDELTRLLERLAELTKREPVLAGFKPHGEHCCR